MSVPDLRTRLQELADTMPAALDDPAAAVARRVQRHRRRVWGGTAAAMVIVLVAATTALITRDSDTRSRHVTTGPTPEAGSATARQLSRFHWSDLPPAPIQPRSDAAVAWTDRELVVWGGVVVGHTFTPPQKDGAAFDPTSNRWRRIAEPTSVVPRWQALTLWTGHEMLVIGGQTASGPPSNDGAYDPSADRWRVLPPRPAEMTGTLNGVWDGHEALVVSLNGQTAAYDPAANAWRLLPPLPEAADQHLALQTLVWTGDQLLVWAESGIELWTLDPQTAQSAWMKRANRSTPDFIPTGIAPALWTGTEVLLPVTTGQRGYRYDPPTNGYRPMSQGPVDRFSRNGVWTGGALVRTMYGANPELVPPWTPTTQPAPGLQPGSAAAWDPDTDTWTTLPSTPPIGETRQLIWTGREILSYGQDVSFRFSP
jgi:hypothetical protein